MSDSTLDQLGSIRSLVPAIAQKPQVAVAQEWRPWASIVDWADQSTIHGDVLSHSPASPYLKIAEAPMVVYSDHTALSRMRAFMYVSEKTATYYAPSTSRKKTTWAIKRIRREGLTYKEEITSEPPFPSDALCNFIIEGVRTTIALESDNRDEALSLTQIARDHLRRAVFGLFKIIADRIRHDTTLQSLSLSTEVEGLGLVFSEEICRAINARVRVSYFKEHEFLSRLHKEIALSAKTEEFNGKDWRIVTTSDGAIELISPPRNSESDVFFPRKDMRSKIVKHNLAISSDAYI